MYSYLISSPAAGASNLRHNLTMYLGCSEETTIHEAVNRYRQRDPADVVLVDIDEVLLGEHVCRPSKGQATGSCRDAKPQAP